MDPTHVLTQMHVSLHCLCVCYFFFSRLLKLQDKIGHSICGNIKQTSVVTMVQVTAGPGVGPGGTLADNACSGDQPPPD